MRKLIGAAADELAWFLGGDANKVERDYWFYEVSKFDSDIVVNEETFFHNIIYVATLITPSPDDALKLISSKASKEMYEKIGKEGVKKFEKAAKKIAAAQGESGVKKLKGAGIKGFMYEVKVKGQYGAYRLLGNKTETGEIFWEVFEKVHK